MIRELIENLLDDDEGISSESYSSLLEYLASVNEMSLIEEVNNRVKSSDGRYYFMSIPGEAEADDNRHQKRTQRSTSYEWKDPNDPQNW